MGISIKLFRTLAASLALTTVVGTASRSASANIIDDTYGVGAGSFELGNYVPNTTNGVGDPFERLPDGSTAITGWTVTSGTIDWYNAPLQVASDGTKSVDTEGAGGTCSISTTIPTVNGASYQLTFDGYSGLVANTAGVTAGSLNTIFSGPFGFPASSATYSNFSYTFVAQSTSTTITFGALTTDGFGPVIDNVSVTPVPEPASISLLGLAGVGLLTRRRPRRTITA